MSGEREKSVRIYCYTCREKSFDVSVQLAGWIDPLSIICTDCQEKKEPNLEWPEDLRVAHAHIRA